MRGITQGARGITLGAFVPVKKTKSCPDQNVLDLIKIQTENISLHDEIDKLRGIIADRDSAILALEISLNEAKSLIPKSENKPLFSAAVQSSPIPNSTTGGFRPQTPNSPKVQSIPRSLLAPLSDKPKMQVLSAGLPKSSTTARPQVEGPQVPGPQIARRPAGRPPAGRPLMSRPPVGRPPAGRSPATRPPAGRPPVPRPPVLTPTANRPPVTRPLPRPPVAAPQRNPKPQGNSIPSEPLGPKKVRIYHDSNLRWSSPSQIKDTFKGLSLGNSDNFNIELSYTPTLEQLVTAVERDDNTNATIVISTMTNNAKDHQSVSKCELKLKRVVGVLTQQTQAKNIIFLESPPSFRCDIFPYNNMAYNLCKSSGLMFSFNLLSYVHIKPDGLHIKRAFKHLMVKSVAAALAGREPFSIFGLTLPRRHPLPRNIPLPLSF